MEKEAKSRVSCLYVKCRNKKLFHKHHWFHFDHILVQFSESGMKELDCIIYSNVTRVVLKENTLQASADKRSDGENCARRENENLVEYDVNSEFRKMNEWTFSLNKVRCCMNFKSSWKAQRNKIQASKKTSARKKRASTHGNARQGSYRTKLLIYKYLQVSVNFHLLIYINHRQYSGLSIFWPRAKVTSKIRKAASLPFEKHILAVLRLSERSRRGRRKSKTKVVNRRILKPLHSTPPIFFALFLFSHQE